MKIERSLRLGLLSLTLLALSGCWTSEKTETKTAPTASATEATTHDRFKLINVLDKALYDDAHIEGSINIDYSDIEKAAANWDKATTIIVYCSNYPCTASSSAARMLSNLGFADVRAYEGGMAEWYQLSQQDPSYKVTGPAKQDYLAVATKKSAEAAEGVKVITAEELKELLAKYR